jgi:uncharacterized protein YgiM (DUF1202 family)
MKKKLWIVFAAAISTSLLAQDATNSAPVLQAPPPPEPTTMQQAPPPPPPATELPPVMEAPTNAPAASHKAKPAKKKTVARKPVKAVAKKPATELRTVPLISGPAVVSANHVNVRSKAGLVGEVLTRMTNGESVTVIEEIHLRKSGPDEPSAWAKILLPPETHVWVKSSLLDTNNSVTPKKVNLRAGPGENYGVVGILERGNAVQAMDTKGDWTQIQAPTNAYAFMAAQYLKQEEGATVAAMPMPETPATTTMMPEAPGVASPPTEAPGTMTMPMDTNPAPVVGEAPAIPVAQEPPPPRIVEHEGIVRGTFSIQAPTRYELISQDTKQPVNYLYTTSTNLDLSRYKGMHIIVTGEEGVDPRWGNTPVITIQRIQVLD